MNISELAKTLKSSTEPVFIRRQSFHKDEYIAYAEEYPSFYCCSIDNPAAGYVMEWWPSLEDLAADDWEIANEPG